MALDAPPEDGIIGQVLVLLGTSTLSGFCPTKWDVPTVHSCAKPTCTHLAYCAVFTNNAFDNNRGILLAFPTNNWNIFNSDVRSFRAPNSDLQGKWNASLAKAQRNPFVNCRWSFSTTSLAGDSYLYFFWVSCQCQHRRVVALKWFLGRGEVCFFTGNKTEIPDVSQRFIL